MKSRKTLMQLKRFELAEKARQVKQIEGMIANFERMVQGLSEQIRLEHKQTGINDINHYAYSTFAQAAHQRQQNLLVSIGDLRQRLEPSRSQLTEAIEELKKYDILAERTAERQNKKEADVGQAYLDALAITRSTRMQ